MPYIKRRQFLQFAGSTLATLGLSQLDIIRQGDRYARVLAQSTPRKLALLVGINQYPPSSNGLPALSGCINDVELQKELLTYRFGFNPKDIYTLTDGEATREGILKAFEAHLINQAKLGDVVVFHYSGHGSQVFDPDGDEKDGLNSTFVPINSPLPAGFPQQGGIVQDIMGHTLFLLMYALKTENVTVVLDSCHSGGGTRGNLIVRSRAGGSQLQPSPAEIEYQRQWLARLPLSSQEFIQKRRAGVAKGVVIAAAKRDQFAADATFEEFHAGAFTYLLTQYLWQQTGNDSLERAFVDIERSTTRIAYGQEPEYEVKPNSNNEGQPLYFLNTQPPPSEAVITQVQAGNQVQLWLGGVSSDSIAAFDKGAILTVVDAQGHEQGLVQIESRQQLIGQAKLLKDVKPGVLKPGALLQERLRVIPTNVTLRIGLDPSLGNDKAKAEQALKGIKQVQALPVQRGLEVEYILGRITQSNRSQFHNKLGEELPAVGSVGLFTPALEPIPGSFDTTDEPVETAVTTRLKSKFKSLLAARLVKMILNPNSSQLNVVVSMKRADSDNQILASTFTVRGIGRTKEPDTPPSATQTNFEKGLPVGTRLQFQVTNNERQDLHVSILAIDPEGEMTVIFPNTWTTTEEATLIQAGETLHIPERNKDRFKLTVEKPLGTVEVLVIASGTPLRESLKALQAVAARNRTVRGPVTLSDDDPIVVIKSLLGDLDQGTRRDRGLRVSPDENFRGIDTKQLAAMSITFRSIEKSNS